MAYSKYRTEENQLRFSKEQSHTWIDHSPACTKVVDLDFNLQFMSLSGVQALAIEDINEYYGKPYPLEFYPQFFREEMTKSLLKARDIADVVIHEGIILDLDGNELWFHSTISPVIEEGDQIDYFMVVSIDTTKQNIARMELEELNRRLEEKVYTRTLELEKVNKQLFHQSQTDFLTNLPNRLFFDRRIGENIATAKRNKDWLSILMVDIDHFKIYNDKYGHDNGDIVLQKIAEAINTSLLRETDIAARFGGEEFVILLPATDANKGFAIAERIRINIELLNIQYGNSDVIINPTVSIGISSLKGDSLNATDILKQADNALYVAKNNGRNNCQVFQ